MQTDSNSPTHVGATPHSGKLLIPRSHRQKFFFQFTLMTVLGWVVGGIASIGLEKSILGGLPPADSFHWAKILGNIVFAVVFAADQALVLRRYISGRLWILATSIGWLIANSVAIAWINYISSIANSFNQGVSPELAFIWGFLSTFSYILTGIWLGFCQWLALRRYVKQAWLWIFLPSVSFFLISIFVWLLSLVQDLIPEVNRTPILYWSEQTFTAIILGVIPAIGLCTLKRNSHRPTKSSSSSTLSNS
ncbi:hypothetical protein PN465_03805 [Nodularia spumigena CS-584]|jgi:hypothetical protein|uniref:Uncharacterized protein n=2 Tax=Nodularia spumigena TaxID=70799 RepID=A0A2S0Q8L7_NODSP|nr:hypothetical protein [Nodularia spumigena]AHJ29806.1 hypothetical protein NSP_34820 [Nodularia spumigena CCY9414]AVZ30650.1 hypothetical protein BMF81_02479 [Nodularia spumigena UHCC 0039]EAW42801.1 hypothetical protein N9414_00500 [Nodularia spumigena CCY9414]MDB9381365.1 hypothetical protein [Nodularia spumigena CS-584]MEA5525913.1 hypothetical protein [Nodularia spumigena UHCC 0143]